MHTCFYTVQYDETWTKRFSSSCEVSEGPDLKCTLIWLALEKVISPDNTIREESNVSCQDELMVKYEVKYVYMKVYWVGECIYSIV